MTTTKCIEAGREKQPGAAGTRRSLSSHTGGERRGVGFRGGGISWGSQGCAALGGLIPLWCGQRGAQHPPALPEAIAEVKGRCPPRPTAHAAMLGKHSRHFGGGMPKGLEWEGVAGGFGGVGGDGRCCDGEFCAPRAPSCPWHEAKHSRAPAGRSHPVSTPHTPPPETRI